MRTLSTSFAFLLLSSFTVPAQVAIPDTAAPAKRIWCATMLEHQDAWFRRTLEFTKPGQKPRLYFSCDNECEVFVDGREVGACNDHQQLTIVTLEEALRGKVTI